VARQAYGAPWPYGGQLREGKQDMNTYDRLLPRHRHPIMLGLGILFAFTAVAAFWPLFLAIAIEVAGLCCALLVALWVYDRERQAIFDYRRALRARAEYENWLWMRGDPRGFYGRYPPAVRIAPAPVILSGGGADCYEMFVVASTTCVQGQRSSPL
jgi:hypothetical protein